MKQRHPTPTAKAITVPPFTNNPAGACAAYAIANLFPGYGEAVVKKYGRKGSGYDTTDIGNILQIITKDDPKGVATLAPTCAVGGAKIPYKGIAPLFDAVAATGKKAGYIAMIISDTGRPHAVAVTQYGNDFHVDDSKGIFGSRTYRNGAASLWRTDLVKCQWIALIIDKKARIPYIF